MTPEDIKAARKSAGMTQQQVADALEINIRSYQKIEAGEVNMAPGTKKLFTLFVVNCAKKN